MPPTLHQAFDTDERRMRDAAANELWTDALVDRVVDVASPLLDAGVPPLSWTPDG